MKETHMKKVSKKVRKELEALAKLPDDQIDLSDIPEVKDWSGAVRGLFYRPVKRPLTLRLDADVLAWLKSQGPAYQTRINQLLRATMISQLRRRKKAS
jgi:uncharacterized protein (DUF4415 family)